MEKSIGTKIELLPNSTPDANDAHRNPLSVGNNSILCDISY